MERSTVQSCLAAPSFVNKSSAYGHKRSPVPHSLRLNRKRTHGQNGGKIRGLCSGTVPRTSIDPTRSEYILSALIAAVSQKHRWTTAQLLFNQADSLFWMWRGF